MAVRRKGGRSFAEDRRLIALAGSLKSLEAVASELGRNPEAVARSAKRLGISLKSRDSLRARAPWLPRRCLIPATEREPDMTEIFYPTPELADDALIEDVRLATRIRNALIFAGIKVRSARRRTERCSAFRISENARSRITARH
jgi:hypothetical protein